MTSRSAGPRIIGIIQCKNEWALGAVSITHALQHHVDEVYVVDHASTDRSARGLAHLRALWPGRLHVLRLNGGEFHQEVSAAVAVHLCQASAPDWIYVFDADEFLLAENGRSLREILGALPPDCVALRYPLHNYVSVEDLDECALPHYERIRHRAVPRDGLDLGELEWSRAIHDGELTFFDYPFPSKVVFRNVAAAHASPGAHLLWQFGPAPGGEVESAEVSAAHVTYPTRERLDRKAAYGKLLVQQGHPPTWGWQLQLAHRLAEEGRLDWFWARHSIPAGGAPGPLSPSCVPDDRLAKAVGPAIAFLERGFGSRHLSRRGEEELAPGGADETQVALQSVVELQRKALLALRELEAARDAARAEAERGGLLRALFGRRRA